MTTYRIKKIRNGKSYWQEIDGILLGNGYFAARREERGYRITHLPSGLLVTESGFASVKDALGFVKGMEKVFGKELMESKKTILQQAVQKDSRRARFYYLIQDLNNDPKSNLKINDVHQMYTDLKLK